MGKRELLLIVAFAAIGVVIYQLTAPPPKEGEQGFSLSRLLGHVRREVRGNSTGSHVHRGSIAAPAALTHVRLSNVQRITVVGEARADIDYELTVRASAPDQETAVAAAQRVSLKEDLLGTALALRVIYPRDTRFAGNEIVLKVPSRLAVQLESGSAVNVTNVAGLDLTGVSGPTTVTGVAERVSGTHQRGELRVSEVGQVNLRLVGSEAEFTGVRKGLTLNVGNTSTCKVTGSHGPVELDETNAEVTVENQDGPVRVRGTGGRIVITRARQPVNVDARRAEVEVSTAEAIAMMLLTTGETLRLLLDGPPPITIEAVASDGGKIQAGDFQLTPEASDQEARLEHNFGSGATPRVMLRNVGADIVIRKR